MFTRNFTAGRGWHDATIGPCRPLALDPAVIAMRRGQMVFEGTKAYARTDGHPNLFRPDKSVEVAAANRSRVVGT